MTYDPNKIFTVQMRQDILIRTFIALSNDEHRIEHIEMPKYIKNQDDDAVANSKRLLAEINEAEENFVEALHREDDICVFINDDDRRLLLNTLYAYSRCDEKHRDELVELYNKVLVASGR